MKGKKVLIAEDNDLNRKLFENLIGQYWDFKSVINGQEAIDLLKKEKFDLILMDIQMPKMDGISAMKKIRQQELTDCPIVAVSAFAEESYRQEFLLMGFSDFLTKPIRPQTFLKVLQAHLAKGKKEEQDSEKYPNSSLLLDKKVFLQLLKYNLKEKITTLLDDFITETDQIFEIVQQALKTRDKNVLIENFHTLKGNSGTLGANSIYQITAELESKVKNENWKDVEALFSKLKTEKELFENYIKEETIFES